MSGKALDYDLPKSCKQAAGGSSWAALLVAINTKPKSLRELLGVVGGDGGCFDAVADAWAIYQDALINGADL